MISQLHEFTSSILDIIYPPVCPGCQLAILDHHQFICETCEKQLTPFEPPVCNRCGHTLGIDDPVDRDGTCIECPPKPIGFKQARSVLSYDDDVVKELIHLLKYKYITSLAIPLGEILNEGFEKYFAKQQFDCIAPVPLHKKRLREREFNQSELIAKHISAQHQIPIQNNLIDRIRPTSPQAHLHPKQRQNNVKGAFACKPSSGVAGLKILVIDDVMTTGATVNEVCLELKKHGAKAVYALTLARALYVFTKK